jgi:predicted RNA methylase
MRYPAESIRSRHSVPKLMGSYECELHELIETALHSIYNLVIDIGSAEGYYAVGFALKGASPVITFETDPRELKLCQEMARANQVGDRITARGWCSPAALRNLTLGARCFVLSDCEGYEIELFDEPTVEALRRSDVLIETHGNAYEPLLERFSKTHAVRTVSATERSAGDYPELACLGGDAVRALTENRVAGQRWLYASARPE